MPAQVVVACGIFGNISGSDIRATVGVHRLTGESTVLVPGQRLFTFPGHGESAPR